MVLLDPESLETTVTTLAKALESLSIDYAIMGGAAVCLLAPDQSRKTEDVDLVIHVDHRMITAGRLTQRLLDGFPNDFAPISQYGHTIPAYKLCLPQGLVLVELEVFDYQSWPQRPQYNIPNASRMNIVIGGQVVKVFSVEWVLREKIISRYQRRGSQKEGADLNDIITLLPMAIPGISELDFNENLDLHAPLASLLQARPDLSQLLKAKIKCTFVLQN